MNWALAIERNRVNLLRIIAALIVSLGLREGERLTTLPAWLYRKALAIIRPTEAALRRLIFVAARRLMLEGFKVRLRADNGSLSVADGFDFSRLNALPASGLAAFALIEPMKTFGEELPDFGAFGDAFRDDADNPSAYAPIPAASLGQRLLALNATLENLPRHARRLARWFAERDAARKRMIPHRTYPMRPGLPPSWKHKHRDEADEALRECHWLAGFALDSS